MKPFDLEAAKAGAPVIQRCGRPARIVDFNLKNGEYPLAVVYTDGYNDEHVTEFSTRGEYYRGTTEDERDLMMAPVKKTGWLNVYPAIDGRNVYPTSSLYETQAEADLAAGAHRLRCLPVEWED